MTEYVTEDNFGRHLSKFLRSTEVHHIKDGQVIKVENSLEHRYHPDEQYWYPIHTHKTVEIKE